MIEHLVSAFHSGASLPIRASSKQWGKVSASSFVRFWTVFAPFSRVPPVPPNGREDGREQYATLCVTNIHVSNIDGSNPCESQTRSYPRLEAILSRGMSKAASESGLLNSGTVGKVRKARS
jgi:hypothetical protein